MVAYFSPISSLPFIHWPPASDHPLIDDPLVVPDAALIADGVEAIAVSVASPRHVDEPGETS